MFIDDLPMWGYIGEVEGEDLLLGDLEKVREGERRHTGARHTTCLSLLDSTVSSPSSSSSSHPSLVHRTTQSSHSRHTVVTQSSQHRGRNAAPRRRACGRRPTPRGASHAERDAPAE